MSETSTELVLPYSGELIDLTNPGSCAKALEEIRGFESTLRWIKQKLTEALVEEATKQGSKTLHLTTGDYSIGGGSKIEWDIEELEKLRDAGLPEGRFDALVQTVITYKVNAAEAKRIAGANPDYAVIIERAKVEAPAPYHVSFKSAP